MNVAPGRPGLGVLDEAQSKMEGPEAFPGGIRMGAGGGTGMVASGDQTESRWGNRKGGLGDQNWSRCGGSTLDHGRKAVNLARP